MKTIQFITATTKAKTATLPTAAATNNNDQPSQIIAQLNCYGVSWKTQIENYRKMKWKLPAYKSESVNALTIIFEIERGSHFFVIIAQQD